jgi:hypothetical protein
MRSRVTRLAIETQESADFWVHSLFSASERCPADVTAILGFAFMEGTPHHPLLNVKRSIESH